MIEFKINNGLDREKIVVGLANSGYKVKVIKKPVPNKYLQDDYYVQVEEGEEVYTKEELKQIVKMELSKHEAEKYEKEIEQLEKQIVESMRKIQNGDINTF